MGAEIASEARTRRGAGESGQREPVDLEIVVPALNAEGQIGATLKAFVDYLKPQRYSSALVIVDTGSVDGTRQAVVDASSDSPVPIHFMSCASRGKGAAVRRGVLTSQARFLGIADPDVGASVRALDTVWPLLQEGAQMVIAPRWRDGSPEVPGRWLMQRAGSTLTRTVSNPLLGRVADVRLGFEFFVRKTAVDLFATCPTRGAGFDIQLLISARAARLDVREVPIPCAPAPEEAAPESKGRRWPAFRALRRGPAVAARRGRPLKPA